MFMSLAKGTIRKRMCDWIDEVEIFAKEWRFTRSELS
jgi:hypothetical protein